MAAKKVTKIVKLQIVAGKANPAPPVGPALGQAGVNIMAFCKEFNAKTQSMGSDVVPVVITVYHDKSFTFITRQPPISRLILKELNLESGSKVPNKDKVGKLKKTQVEKIAKQKAPDMRVRSVDAGMRMVMGTARSMGVDIIEG